MIVWKECNQVINIDSWIADKIKTQGWPRFEFICYFLKLWQKMYERSMLERSASRKHF